MLTNLPVPYDLCIRFLISFLLIMGKHRLLCPNSVLNVKALVGAFNQEKALVGTLPMIVKLQTSRRFVSSSNGQCDQWEQWAVGGTITPLGCGQPTIKHFLTFTQPHSSGSFDHFDPHFKLQFSNFNSCNTTHYRTAIGTESIAAAATSLLQW